MTLIGRTRPGTDDQVPKLREQIRELQRASGRVAGRVGTVVGDPFSGRVQVTLASAGTGVVDQQPTRAIRYLSTYVPAIGDNVIVIATDAGWVILGALEPA
jgi:hypothetical protein